MSQNKDYTDYQQYSWSIPKARKQFRQFFIYRLFYIIPLTMLGWNISITTSKNQKVIVQSQLTALIFIISIISIIIIVFLDYQISKFKPLKIDDFNISKSGIKKNTHFIPIKNINPDEIKKISKNTSKYFRSVDKYIYIKIKVKNKFFTLAFSSKNQAEKCIKALADYTKNY